MINLLGTIKTLSPMHCGIGIGASDIDLPVARHKVSNHPLVPGSTLKGVLKDEFLNRRTHSHDREKLTAIFGGDGAEENTFASAISIGDMLLLALPVRSFFGTFAYLASPYTLERFKAILTRTMPEKEIPPIPTGLGLKTAGDNYRVMLTSDSLLLNPAGDRVLLEELDLLTDSASADAWAELIGEIFCDDDEEKAIFCKRFAIADDNALNFLCDTALPVDAHIRIDEETGTVARGALWYEETVPMESLFFGLVGMDRSFKSEVQVGAEDLAAVLLGGSDVQKREILTQIGGKATTGKGFVSVVLTRGV